MSVAEVCNLTGASTPSIEVRVAVAQASLTNTPSAKKVSAGQRIRFYPKQRGQYGSYSRK